MVTIWFEAHSTSLDNEAKLASGWNDVDLSELGIKQNFELRDRCKDRKIDAIFCSDLQRSVKSAVPTSNSFHIPIYIDERLRECNYGVLTQKPKAEVDQEKPYRISQPFESGESYEDCMVRMKSFLDWLQNEFEGKTVLIVGHRATQYGLDHHISGKSLKTCVTDPWSWQPGWKYKLS